VSDAVHLRGSRSSGQLALCGVMVGRRAHEMVTDRSRATCTACLAASPAPPRALDPLVEALALAVTAYESDLYWTAGAGNEAAIADGHKARLSAVLAAARAVVAAGSDGGAFVPDLAETLAAADAEVGS
jgi:hypothetical protein